jgi:hypothetical protein
VTAPTRILRYGPPLATLVASGFLAVGFWLGQRRGFDPDELVHLHAGYSVWQGLAPYRDFFDHHGAVLWYLSLPLFETLGPTLEVLFAGRALVWTLGAGTVLLTWLLGRRWYGRWGGPIAALLLVSLVPFQSKMIEWRPDNVALLLVLLAFFFLDASEGRRGNLRAGLAGAALAAAFFCTQKLAYLALGAVGGFAWGLFSAPAPGRWQRLVAMVGGAWSVAGAVALFYGAQGLLGDFLEMTILTPLRWPATVWTERVAAPMLGASPIFWSAAGAGFALSLSDCLRGTARNPAAHAVLAGAAAQALGALHVPAPYLQYYLPLWPLAALLGSRAFLELADDRSTGRAARSGRSMRLLAALVGSAVAAACTAIAPYWTAVILVTAAVVALAGIFGRPRLILPALLASLVWGAAPLLQAQFRWSHEEQSRRFAGLLRGTTEEDRFFDGFSGYGALRPHAFRFFWINRHTWPLVPEAERSAGVMRALSDPRTRVVLYDRHLRKLLPPDVRRYIEEHFAEDERYSSKKCRVLVRRGRELG